MKIATTLLLSLISTYAPSVSSRSIPSEQLPSLNHNQAPIMPFPNVPLPQFGSSSEPSGELTISDVIGNERAINIFAGFTRDVEVISRRLESNEQNATVLAPVNSELQKLPRKPWEDPKDYGKLGESAYEGSEGEDRAHQNLRRFVEAHVVPLSPWEEGQKVESLGGRKVWWETKDDKRIVGIRHTGCGVSTDDAVDSAWKHRGFKRRKSGGEWRGLGYQRGDELRIEVGSNLV
ncbi:MAG: hypothetical protein Q9187_001248 [Circinaria calcarea]